MFANFLIGLREGLEAALVVSILVSYLVKSGRRDLLPRLWIGVGLAILLALTVGAMLTFTTAHLSFEAQEAFGGFMSILAVGLVTWMVFWMARTSRGMRGELHQQMSKAVGRGAWALVVVAFVAVAREGVETALFLWAAIRATGDSAGPFAGAGLGLVVAVFIGYLFYRGALKINLAVFFRWTGVALIVIAAGVLSYGIHDLQEAAILPGLHDLAFDVTATIPANSWYGTLLKGTINFSPATTKLELIIWLLYMIAVLPAFLWITRKSPKAKMPEAPMTASSESVPNQV